EDVRRAVVPRQLIEGHVTAEGDVTQTCAPYRALVAVELARSDDDQPAVRNRALHADKRPDQKAQTLAFLRPPDKQHIALPVAELRQRLELAREVLDVHAVRDHVVVPRKILLDV